MPTLAARVTELERLADRLVASQGSKVSDELRLARVRAQSGSPAPPILQTVEELERQAHGTGLRELVPAMSRAAVAAGADALIIEVHTDPDSAVSDGRQSLTLEEFNELMGSLRRIAAAVDRSIAEPVHALETA